MGKAFVYLFLTSAPQLGWGPDRSLPCCLLCHKAWRWAGTSGSPPSLGYHGNPYFKFRSPWAACGLALRGWDPILSHFGVVTPPMHGTYRLTIDLHGVCAQGYPSPWLCHGVPLRCGTASGDAATQLMGSPFVLPIRRDDRHFPVSCSGVISSSVQNC